MTEKEQEKLADARQKVSDALDSMCVLLEGSSLGQPGSDLWLRDEQLAVAGSMRLMILLHDLLSNKERRAREAHKQTAAILARMQGGEP